MIDFIDNNTLLSSRQLFSNTTEEMVFKTIPEFSTPICDFLSYSSAHSNHQSSIYLQFRIPKEKKILHKNLRILRFQIRIAGQEFVKVFAASQNASLEWEFVWNQRNSYGQLEYGLVNVYCNIF